jgi:hypothetical protein
VLVLIFLRGVGLDLSNACDVIVEKGVKIGCGIALGLITTAGIVGVDPGSQSKEGDWQCRPHRNRRANDIHGDANRENLDDRDQSELNAINQYALHGGDVLDDPGHDVTGPAAVEPAKREPLDLLIEIRADVEDNPLLKVVVENDAGAVQGIFDKKGE